jgi:hypothetical protein
MGKRQQSTDKGHATSKGQRRQARARQQIQRLAMKVARWERNQADQLKEHAGKSRKNWDTRGIKAHIELLKKVASKPAKRV